MCKPQDLQCTHTAISCRSGAGFVQCRSEVPNTWVPMVGGKLFNAQSRQNLICTYRKIICSVDCKKNGGWSAVTEVKNLESTFDLNSVPRRSQSLLGLIGARSDHGRMQRSHPQSDTWNPDRQNAYRHLIKQLFSEEPPAKLITP